MLKILLVLVLRFVVVGDVFFNIVYIISRQNLMLKINYDKLGKKKQLVIEKDETCPSCGEQGIHWIPSVFGLVSEGFYSCRKKTIFVEEAAPVSEEAREGIDFGDGYWACGKCHTTHGNQYDAKHCCLKKE